MYQRRPKAPIPKIEKRLCCEMVLKTKARVNIPAINARTIKRLFRRIGKLIFFIVSV